MKVHTSLLHVMLLAFLLAGCGTPSQKPHINQTKPVNATSPISQTPDPAYEKHSRSSISEAPAKQESEPASGTDPESFSISSDQEKTSPPVKIQPLLDEALDFCEVAQEFWQKGELEAAIEALDKAYSLIINIEDEKESPTVIQQKEDIRFMISKRILEIYASRNIIVNGNHNEIPLVLNKHVQAEINLFTKGKEKKFFLNAYIRSGRYRDYIVKELKAAGLPEELSWLPLIESGYKENALSKARALGLWQFIPSTGYKFGLKRDKYIDERLDPVKSTTSAIAYLKELHQIFGDWSTVLAGYNCGEGRVLRVIRSQNVNYLDNFWDLYERLPRETARYVPRFLATLHIIQNPGKYGITLPEVDSPLEFETVTISKRVHLKNVGQKIGVAEKYLKRLNPELRYKIVPNERYHLRVPPGKGKILLASINQIPVAPPPGPPYVYHRVRAGETLSTIARRYRTSVKNIMRANNLRKSNYIVAGKSLKIPSRGYVSYAPTKRRIPLKSSKYIVKRGDSLWIIAKRFGTTTKKIQAANNLSTTRLKIGQVLKIPGRSVSGNSGSRSTYIVKPGDSPYLIAKKHRMSLSRLLSINRLTPRCKIYPGQRLYVE